MESARSRLFDRARELGSIKKARLDQVEEPNSLMSYRDRERDTESVESGGRGSFSQEILELVAQYRTALAELTSNSKPIITNLTIIAGENLHAAKAIAATICANILELARWYEFRKCIAVGERGIILSHSGKAMTCRVPSDQKLPSLYLLDSIVKNIGRDYIKYFGARLPEIFCKAYRHVDLSTHANMRHLFGTWKGVFPPQPLQIIEKELAFSNTANGSSSGSQSQRPANSIHVNPKYLEARQRLQQPNRDTERLDRTVGMNSGRQWLEPTLKTQSTQRQRDAPDEYVREKNIIATYGSYDNDSDHSSQSGLEMGRTKKRVIDPPSYMSNHHLEEKMSIRRNGLDIKQGYPSFAAPTAEKSSLHLMPGRSFFGKTDSGIEESWKSSDEEEYMWDDLKSKASAQQSIGVSQRHRWTPEEPNISGLESTMWRPQNMPEIGSKIDREVPIDALVRNRRSPSWTEEPLYTAETIYSGSGRGKLGNSERFANPLNSLSMPTNSLTRTSIPLHMSPSHVGTSNFGLLKPLETVSSVPVGQKRQFVPDYLAEQDCNQSKFPRRPEIEKPPFSQPQNMKSQFSPDTLSTNSPKFPPKKLQKTAPIVHSVLPKHHIPVTESSSQYIPSTAKSLSNQTNKKNVASSKLKNEKLTKKSGTSTIVSVSAQNPPLPKVTRTVPKLTAGSSTGQASQVKSSTAKPLSKKKAAPPPLPVEPPPSDSASDPVSSLLSTLMAKGLITASKSESPKSTIVDKSPDPAVTSVPVALKKMKSPDKNDTPKSAEKCFIDEVKPLIGLEFKPDLIRQSHPTVISQLLDNFPHQCNLCGLRLKLKERFERHIEWHDLRKPENSQKVNSRSWYANMEKWVSGEDEICSEEETSEEPEEDAAMVPADENQCVCVLCGEIFEDFYDKKTDEWMFKEAVYLSVPLEDSKGPIVHSNCISESSLNDLGFPAP